MTTLKMTTKITNYVDYGDLQSFLTEKLGKSVEIVGSSNDTDYSVDVKKLDPASTMYKWYMEEVQEFINSGIIDCEYNGFHRPLAYAATQGWIPEGEYLITVSW